MSQHDYVIDNATGASVRSDLNNVLQAIVTNNSGATAPTTTYPNMFWYDTANSVLKKRTNADDGWEEVAPITEIVPVYSSTVTYSLGDIINDGTGVLYKSLVNGNLNNPVSDASKWASLDISIDGLTEKTTPAATDLLLIEDSASSYTKKKLQLSNLGIGMKKVSSTTLTAEASKTISGLEPGKKYKAIFNLLQNTSDGNVYLRINGDTGTNYSFVAMLVVAGTVSHTGGGAGEDHILMGATVGDGESVQGEYSFMTVPGNSKKVSILGQTQHVNDIGGQYGWTIHGFYSGASDFSSITVYTSAGTLTGTIDVYEFL